MENIELLKEFIKTIEDYEMPDYDKFPDIELYMDQVLTYILKVTNGINEDNQITSSMINNYVKAEIIPSPVSKKYDSDHLSKILTIMLLKPTLSMNEIKSIFDNVNDSKEFYHYIKEVQKESFNNVASYTSNELENVNEEDINKLVIKLAINSYVNKLIAQKILSLKTKALEEDSKKKKKKE